MIVPIKQESNCTEWAIIELHGDLKKLECELLDNTYIGNLYFTQSGIPILIIGSHILYGKETSMEKPFAVMKKHTTTDQDSGNTLYTEYIIKAIVRKKLLFKSRPKHIIYKVPKSD